MEGLAKQKFGETPAFTKTIDGHKVRFRALK